MWRRLPVVLLTATLLLDHSSAFPALAVARHHASSSSHQRALNHPEYNGQENLSCHESKVRRSFLASGVASIFLGSFASAPSMCQASQVRGPIELLRPASRVKVYINTAISMCQDMKKQPQNQDTLQPLAAFFEKNPVFMTLEEEKLSKRYLEINTSSAWQAARLKELETRGAELGIDYTTPYDRFNTAVQQMGDRRTFQNLRKRQRGLDSNNVMRAAFNAYTNNLVFGDNYQLNVEGEAKKALVRNDALPNVNAVVVSDLDLRDLYRNQVLQNVEDARFEIAFQTKPEETVDVEEILIYLRQAQAACDDWFGFIPQSDVEQALKDVLASRDYSEGGINR